MNARTYRAGSMKEALELIRRDLGPDASVLHTRHAAGGWWRWLFGSNQIEVTASVEIQAPSRLPQQFLKNQGSGASRTGAADSTVVSPSNASKPPVKIASPVAESEPAPKLAEAMRRAAASSNRKNSKSTAPKPRRAPIHNVSRRRRIARTERRSWPDSLFRLYAELIDMETPEEIARNLLDRLADDELCSQSPPGEQRRRLKSAIANLIAQRIKVSGPISVVPSVVPSTLPSDGSRPRIAAFVGPTGVGKTTTIAKLAANFHLREKRRVGLITIDTFRIAAAEQLAAYAQIMNVPMEVVSGPEEMTPALERLKDVDLVLVDTAGHGPQEEVRLKQLRRILQFACVDEVHLVLSASSNPSALLKITNRFAPLGASALLVTKLDEATGLGALLPLLLDSPLPLSYLANGQNVPDDIELADAQRLSKRIVNHD